MVDESQPALRARLDALAGRAKRHLGAWQRARDLRRGVRRAWIWAPAGPVLGLLYQLGRVLAGDGGASGPWWAWLALLVAGPSAALAVWLIRASRLRGLSRRECLGAFDLQLSTRDRLVIADEFLRSADAGAGAGAAFRHAAIEDAATPIAEAERTTLVTRPLPALALSRRAAAALATAAIAVVLNLWLGTATRVPVLADGRTDVVLADPAALAARLFDRWTGRNPEARRQSRPPGATPDAASDADSPPETSPRADQMALDAAGGSQSGGQARSRSTSQAMSSAGSPSNQKNPSEPLDDDPPQDQPTSTPSPPRPPDGRKAEPQASSATSGQGQSRSSSVDRSAIPAVDQPDRAGANKDDGKDEEGADDADEEEKAAGSERPSLRRSKPPVDRNLSPRPAGDEADPDANGRSGPGGRKKTRGVPAMILGIPTPDRIQGMTHPGRSKVTQEQATPREEPQTTVAAESRAPRQAPVGHIQHPRLLPWMLSLVEKYFTREKLPAAAGSGGRE